MTTSHRPTSASAGSGPVQPDEVLPPAKSGGKLSLMLALVGTALSMLYLANLSAGFLELPDNLPLVGNLDEVVVSGILFTCLARLGINVVPHWERRKTTTENK